MSMNLYAKSENGEIYLWQTPTQITYMILPPALFPKGEAKGKKAREALTRYMEWVNGTTNGIWHDQEEYLDAKRSVKEHLHEISLRIHDKKLKVYIQ